MVLSLLYGKKYAQSKIQNRENNFDVVVFDTMVSEEHKFSSRVTYYPVERGTIISDHILNQPDTVILSGLISDTPLNIFAPFNRSISAFNSLIKLHEDREVVNIVTGIKIYKDMAITSLDVPRTIKTGQTLTFNITFQKINFSNNVTVINEVGNIFGGVQDNTSRDIVADNTNIPILQNDPPYSLKDQASSRINVGVQSLDNVPDSILPNVLSNLLSIYGVA